MDTEKLNLLQQLRQSINTFWANKFCLFVSASQKKYTLFPSEFAPF